MSLEVHEALSGISGSISLVAWLFLLLPQLWENYKNQNADGLSLAFLIVWALGDVANLAGSIWGKLLPTVIALGFYFCVLDTALLLQTLYYRSKVRRAERLATAAGDGATANDPTQPLLAPSDPPATSATKPPGKRRRRSTASTKRRPSTTLSTRSGNPHRRLAILWAWNLLAVIGVCAFGALAWVAAWRMGWWKPTPTDGGDDSERILGAEILGYISAVLYLGARLPQIWKNYQDRSCEGLSLLFFILSTVGNGSYGAQILLHSVEGQYVLKNLPWLLGSLGTIAEDVVIFIQFQMYNDEATLLQAAVQ